MNKIKVGINGFGRIGRYLTRLLLEHPSIELVHINDLMPIQTAVHLLKYDSVHGPLRKDVTCTDHTIIVKEQTIHFTQVTEPKAIDWTKSGVQLVVEATGKFLTANLANKHINGTVQKVILSAPAQDPTIPTLVLGVNETRTLLEERILSNASCTTNSAAPLIRIMQELCDIESAYITTVHSYTTDQRLHDSPHKDLRRARAAGESIVPTTTGAAKALTKIFPELEGKLGGCGMRVPVPDGSLTDLTMIVRNPPTIEAINAAFQKASQQELEGILRYTEDPIVSIDIVGDSHSCIFDAGLTSVIGNMVKVVAWYDNEAGYSNRLVDLIVLSQQHMNN